jgi:hypothetical protein
VSYTVFLKAGSQGNKDVLLWSGNLYRCEVKSFTAKNVMGSQSYRGGGDSVIYVSITIRLIALESL